MGSKEFYVSFPDPLGCSIFERATGAFCVEHFVVFWQPVRLGPGATARKGKLQERALTLWLGRGCRDLLRTAWQRWRWHRRGRRVVDRITELTYSGVLAEDAVLLRGCWACWHAMVLKRLRCNHCLKLLRLEQGRATIQLAFQCWRCFVTASEQEAALGEMKCRDRLRSTSAQAVAALQALWRCSIFLQCLRAWSLLILQQRHSRQSVAEQADAEDAFRRQADLQKERALTLWLGRGCRDLLRTAWQRWRWHRRGRRVVDRITELTYSGVLAEDAVLLRGCWACWHAMVLKRLRCNHCLRLLRLEQGRAMILGCCWETFYMFAYCGLVELNSNHSTAKTYFVCSPSNVNQGFSLPSNAGAAL